MSEDWKKSPLNKYIEIRCLVSGRKKIQYWKNTLLKIIASRIKVSDKGSDKIALEIPLLTGLGMTKDKNRKQKVNTINWNHILITMCTQANPFFHTLLSVLTVTFSCGSTRSTSRFHSAASVVDCKISSCFAVSFTFCVKIMKFIHKISLLCTVRTVRNHCNGLECWY